MPKAKPISLQPLTFEQVIDVLIRAAPTKVTPTKKKATVKPKKRKSQS